MEIFQYGFMLRAFGAGIAVAVLCPLIGSFLVLRRYSLLADTLAHVAVLGVAIGFILGAYPVIVAVLTTVFVAILLERVRSARKIYGESALAIFLSGSLALAVVLISLKKGFNVDLFSFLFGTIAAIKPADAYLTAILAAGAAFAIIRLYKPLLYLSVDEDGARTRGINSELLNTFLVVIAAITVSISMKVVGALLVGALMVIPVITAFQIARSFRSAVVIAVVFSLISVVAGLFASYYLNLVAGGSIVMASLAIFLAVLFLRKPSYS